MMDGKSDSFGRFFFLQAELTTGAHPMAPVSKLAWVADGKLVSAGGDTAIRSWDVKLQ
eukprot:m.71166 g.71166  ORF g.71166 m.71166 type:complete len:58 (+) comp7622_c0_seq2:231-404(+)